ncbi:CBS domain-containing protein [Trichoderma breve]|uniref:CBS domain-containing protein n=1 Tax=Trichoderma breve TaxID=2034170 RepID=A0A9W9JQ55_9HYPO|nr:CBS domain-containing protein [Trichoderma breve]KAJ4863596.1 CBS domain-containing protein [Trichoderma breve]
MKESEEAASAQLAPAPADAPGDSDMESRQAAASAAGPGINNTIAGGSSDNNNDNITSSNNNSLDNSSSQINADSSVIITAGDSTGSPGSAATPAPGTIAPAAAIAPDPASAPASATITSGASPSPAPQPGSAPRRSLASPASSPGSSPRSSPGSSGSASGSAPASAAITPGSAESEPASTPAPGFKLRPPSIALPPFVAPSSYLFHAGAMADAPDPKPLSPLDKEQRQGLKAIRDFLRKRTSYDVLPLSFRLIVLDTDLLIKKSLNILIQNSIVSAPLWDSHTSRFAGILTATDYINVIQYHCQFPDEMSKLDQFRLASLRDIEKAIGATPIESVSVHPSRPLYEALRRMLKTRARRIPLVDVDEETGRETVISVITQYRILKFIAVNNEHNTILLKKTLREIQLGTYNDLLVARMGTTVLEVINLMVNGNISCVPIVDSENRVLNAFEAVDIIPCIKGGAYDELNGSVGEALCKRPEDNPGIFTCSQDDRLDSIFDTIRKSRVHRLIVVDDENKLKGVISLSDILKYVLLHGEEDIPE